MKGYTIGAQDGPKGTPTTGGSPVHNKMKPGILKGEGPRNNAAAAFNRKMYKSEGYGNTASRKGRNGY